jgi:hypothetical protein
MKHYLTLAQLTNYIHEAYDEREERLPIPKAHNIQIRFATGHGTEVEVVSAYLSKDKKVVWIDLV